MNAKGTFEVQMKPEAPYDVEEGVSIGRAHFDKQFQGPLDATSTVEMIGARTADPSSAGYVAIERVRGKLDGREGTFVLQHTGIMNRGALSLVVTVVPSSGTGGLAGISGKMAIEITGGKHFYDFDYAFEG